MKAGNVLAALSEKYLKSYIIIYTESEEAGKNYVKKQTIDRETFYMASISIETHYCRCAIGMQNMH